MSNEKLILRELEHALTFIREGRDTPHQELRTQHLDEAERLVDHIISILGGIGGKTQTQ